jgi:hypothetical protein
VDLLEVRAVKALAEPLEIQELKGLEVIKEIPEIKVLVLSFKEQRQLLQTCLPLR